MENEHIHTNNLNSTSSDVTHAPIKHRQKSNNVQRHKPSGAFRSFTYGALGGLITSSIIVFGTPFIQQKLPKNTTTTSITTVSPVTTTSTSNNDQSVTQAIAKIQDAVVSITNYRRTITNFLFTPQTNPDLAIAGQGSGIIYKIENGYAYVATNNHVINNADELNITLRNGTTVKAEVIGTDTLTDLAVLKIDADNVTTIATFADSTQVLVGQTALAIGSPLGSQLASSVTKGIISAVDRAVEVDTDGDNIKDWTAITLQTDAAINPGNSGGALTDLNGNVIGINSMKISNTSVEGIGFAIPSNQAVNIINALEKNGKVSRPTLGIGTIDLTNISTTQRRHVLNLTDNVINGVVISYIDSQSAAQYAGLQQYDVIVSWNDTAITNTAALRKALYSQQIGDTVQLKIWRNGNEQTISLVLK